MTYNIYSKYYGFIFIDLLSNYNTILFILVAQIKQKRKEELEKMLRICKDNTDSSIIFNNLQEMGEILENRVNFDEIERFVLSIGSKERL